MNRQHYVIVAVLAFASPAPAMFEPVSLAELAGDSEMVAAGKIVRIEAGLFWLEVEDAIAGPCASGETLRILQFQDWACSRRWAAYEVGQRVLVFLNFDDRRNLWTIRGAGCEGESPIVGDEVYARFWVPVQPVEDERFPGAKVKPVPYDMLRKAIVDFRKEFRLTPSGWRSGEYVGSGRMAFAATPIAVPRFRPRRPVTTAAFQDRSPLHRFLTELVEAERKKVESQRASAGGGGN